MTPVSGGTRTRKRGRRFGGGEIVGGYQLGSKFEGRNVPYQAFEALEERSGWRAVLKLIEPPVGLDREALEELANDLRKQARIRQPNVVSLLDAGTDRGKLWVATEQVPEVTLASLLGSGSLTGGTTVAIVSLVAAALDAAHQDGVLHGGLRADSVFVTGDWPLVDDFGIAAAAGPEPAEPSIRSDLRDLAALAHHCFIGYPPTAGSPDEFRRDRPAVAVVFDRAFDDDPTSAWQTGADFMTDLSLALRIDEEEAAKRRLRVVPPPAVEEKPAAAAKKPAVAEKPAKPSEKKPKPARRERRRKRSEDPAAGEIAAAIAAVQAGLGRDAEATTPAAEVVEAPKPEPEAKAEVAPEPQPEPEVKPEPKAKPAPKPKPQKPARTRAKRERKRTPKPARKPAAKAPRKRGATAKKQRPRRGSVARPALAAATATLAVGGFLIGSQDQAPESAMARGAGVELAVPSGWIQNDKPSQISWLAVENPVSISAPEGTATGELVAGRVGARMRALLPGLPGGDLVRLGNVNLLRYGPVPLEHDKREATLYVAPGDRGGAAVACLSAESATRAVTAACESAAATISLQGDSAEDLAPNEDYATGVDATLAKLNKALGPQRKRLAAAKRRAGQVDAANALAKTHRTAAAELGKLDAPTVAEAANTRVREALAHAAQAYTALRVAATRKDRSGFQDARRDVIAAERDLRGGLAELARLGYGS